MARFQIVSDVHFEFHRDGGHAFIRSLDPTDIDALVIAGDLGNADLRDRTVRAICERYPRVLLILGNHDYYGSSFDRVHKAWDVRKTRFPNLTVLRNEIVTVRGIKVGGTTLWFKADPLAPKSDLNDFKYIRQMEPRVYAENRAALTFLERHAGEVDLMVTHHIPTNLGIRPEYRNDPLNPFFVCPVAEFLPGLPKVWVYGHTHTPADFEAGGCRFVCNAFGYPRESKDRYQDRLIIDISPAE